MLTGGEGKGVRTPPKSCVRYWFQEYNYNCIFVQSTTKSIILQDDCSTCISTQSMFIQLGTGIVYPLMGAIGGSYIVNML